MSADVISALMSWAVLLSGYPAPDYLPVVEYKSHEWFMKEACYGGPCDVIGWYRDTNIIYLDVKLKDDESAYVASLVVHELVHVLQHRSGKFPNSRKDCKQHYEREREAFSVQNSYLARVGSPAMVFRQPAACPE